jgi:hypothetical protein
MPRVRQFLCSPRLIMLLVTLGTLLALQVVSVVWRLGQEELARSFVAPDYPLDIPALQRHLGITCVPNTFSITTRWALIEADQAIVEPTLYLGDATLTFQIVFRPYPEGWRITAVDPVPADRSRRVAE